MVLTCAPTLAAGAFVLIFVFYGIRRYMRTTKNKHNNLLFVRQMVRTQTRHIEQQPLTLRLGGQYENRAKCHH